MADLPGIDQDLTFSKEIAAQMLQYKAHRCMQIVVIKLNVAPCSNIYIFIYLVCFECSLRATFLAKKPLFSILFIFLLSPFNNYLGWGRKTLQCIHVQCKWTVLFPQVTLCGLQSHYNARIIDNNLFCIANTSSLIITVTQQLFLFSKK